MSDKNDISFDASDDLFNDSYVIADNAMSLDQEDIIISSNKLQKKQDHTYVTIEIDQGTYNTVGRCKQPALVNQDEIHSSINPLKFPTKALSPESPQAIDIADNMSSAEPATNHSTMNLMEDSQTSSNLTVPNLHKPALDNNLEQEHTQESSFLSTMSETNTNDAILCPFCNELKTGLSSLEIHIEAAHPDSPYKEVTDPDNIESDLMKSDNYERYVYLGVCPYCDQDLGDEYTLQLHMNAAHQKDLLDLETSSNFNCPLCEIVCTSEKDIKLHLARHENDTTTYAVSIDGEENAMLTCPVCGKIMTDSYLLISHVESHFNSKHSPGLDVQNNLNWDILDKEGPSKNNSQPSIKNGDQSNPCKTNSSKSSSTCLASTSVSKKSFTSGNNVTPSSSRASPGASYSKNNFSYKKQYEANLQKAVIKGQVSVSDYHEQMRLMAANEMRGVDDGSTRVTGLIQKLETLFRSQARPGQSAVLCFPTDHYCASYGDKGWGCGYRNFQMLLSCLSQLPDFSARIFQGQQVIMPSILKIQELIESAWQQGFDPQGRAQLDGQVVDTRKWIGATEIVATLSSLGVKCKLADFHSPSAEDGTHPKLLKWVSDYFTRSHAQGYCKAPLYLQHQGHSRTIVGVEHDKGVTKLLLFDPGTPRNVLMDYSRRSLSWKDLRTFRKTQAAFRSQQYQIVAVEGLLAHHEILDSKILKSETVS